MTKVRLREREVTVEGSNPYEKSIVRQQKFMDRQLTGKVVIRDKDREWFQGRQGRLKFYLQEDSPTIERNIVPTQDIFRSGNTTLLPRTALRHFAAVLYSCVHIA